MFITIWNDDNAGRQSERRKFPLVIPLSFPPFPRKVSKRHQYHSRRCLPSRRRGREYFGTCGSSFQFHLPPAELTTPLFKLLTAIIAWIFIKSTITEGSEECYWNLTAAYRIWNDDKRRITATIGAAKVECRRHSRYHSHLALAAIPRHLNQPPHNGAKRHLIVPVISRLRESTRAKRGHKRIAPKLLSQGGFSNCRFRDNQPKCQPNAHVLRFPRQARE